MNDNEYREIYYQLRQQAEVNGLYDLEERFVESVNVEDGYKSGVISYLKSLVDVLKSRSSTLSGRVVDQLNEYIIVEDGPELEEIVLTAEGEDVIRLGSQEIPLEGERWADDFIEEITSFIEEIYQDPDINPGPRLG